jgi:dGTPase
MGQGESDRRAGAGIEARLSTLAPYAARPDASAGRQHPEPPCPMRTVYQRDRDRIVHATAFRRLTYKTQVFVFHEGDHYRSRLTHSLEVAQIARSIARLLRLDEDLAEAIALAHDLGHPPFGHAGERALAAQMAPWGGFDHNAQSLKVVTRLERKYASFDGLNLTFETLEGLAKHNGPVAAGASVLRHAIRAAGLVDALHLEEQAPAEAQVAAIADDIAYVSHDLDDGLRARLLRLDELPEVPLAGRFVGEASCADASRSIHEVIRRMISVLIADVVEDSLPRLDAVCPASLTGVRAAAAPVIAFSPARRGELDALKSYLLGSVYRHPRVMHVMGAAEAIVGDLFALYMRNPAAMPGRWSAASEGGGEAWRAAVVADFVAGMTDRYAVGEHRRLFDATPDLR